MRGTGVKKKELKYEKKKEERKKIESGKFADVMGTEIK
jgi:hypothetical protein